MMAFDHPPLPPYAEPPILTVAQARNVDRYAIEHWGYPSLLLMENAGRNAAAVVYQLLKQPAAARVLVLCGGGNNGGDGFVVARHLRNAGVAVDCIAAVAREKMTADAGTNADILDRLGQNVLWSGTAPEVEIEGAFRQATAVVDALLGTGAHGALRPPMAEWIKRCNGLPAHILRIALDVPTGLDADSGTVGDPTFRADWTITMAAAKPGLATAPHLAGRVVVVDIGAPVHEIPRAALDS